MDELQNRMREVLKGYEQWEANLLMCGESWGPNGMAPLPRLTYPLWDELMELQSKRNEVLKAAKKLEST